MILKIKIYLNLIKIKTTMNKGVLNTLNVSIYC